MAFKSRGHDRNLLAQGAKVVVIGGGTGLSVLLRGLKKFTSNITAIVTVADDGGSSGKLREDLGMLPPGDIRNCILALADTEPIMEKLLQYRFKDGSLKDQNFGNLLIAAMVGISENFEDAIKRIGDIFAVTGKVLPVSIEDIKLYAKLKSGEYIEGESNIPLTCIEKNTAIETVFIKPENARPLQEVKEVINDAEIIVLGPGSLYTSILPNLLVREVTERINESTALKVYVANLMTQPGETDNHKLSDHVKAIINHTNRNNMINYVFSNNEIIPSEIRCKYEEEGAKAVLLNESDNKYFADNKIKVIENNYIDIKKGYLRHDAFSLSKDIIKLLIEDRYINDSERLTELKTILEEIEDIY